MRVLLLRIGGAIAAGEPRELRLIHTSDWQLGKAFGMVDEAAREVLRAERLEAVGRIGALALEHGATTVLVAGDVYDTAIPSDRTSRQPIERMRQFPSVLWHLIPGNHDPHGSSGPWERLARQGIPENIVLHTGGGATPIGDTGAWLLPAVLTRRHAADDPTEGLDGLATPDGAVRIGMAHGSVTSFGSDPSDTHNLIAHDRADRAGLAYLALGDWHGAVKVGPRTAYSGTPEPDGFDLGGRGGGAALLVEIDGPRAMPSISYLPTGRFAWRRERTVLDGDGAIALLEGRLRALHPDPSKLLLWLSVSGALSVAGLDAFERDIRDRLGSALRSLRLDDGDLLMQPSPADLADMARVGSIGAAADILARRAEDPADPRRDLARDALRRLYVMHARQARTA